MVNSGSKSNMGQRYSKTTVLFFGRKKYLPLAMHALAAKFLDAQENNIKLHNYLNARKKLDYFANKTVPEGLCFKTIALGDICL